MKNSISNIIHNVNIVSLILLIAVLPLRFSHLARWIAIILFAVTYTADVIVDKRWESVKFNRRTVYFIILGLFSLLAFVYVPFSDSMDYFWEMMRMRYYILLFSIVGIFGFNTQFRIKYVLDSFIVVAIFYIAFIFFIKLFVKTGLNFNDIRILYVSPHMQFNLLLNIALASCAYILVKGWKSISTRFKILYIISLFPIVAVLLSTEGRSGFIGVILVILFSIFSFIKEYRKLALIFAVIVCVVGFFVIKNHPRMNNFQNEPRLFLWKSVAVPLISERPLLGYGVSDGQVMTMKLFNERVDPLTRSSFPEGARIDVHNQFLQTSIEFGLVGLVLLLFLYLYPLFIVDRRRFSFLSVITILFLWQSIFDSFIVSPFGMYFGIVYTACLCMRPESEGYMV